jgi:flagellar biosynthetic protein FlhB
MSDQVDSDSQTEDATEKKLNDALEHGSAPVSREVALFATLACILVILIFVLRTNAVRLVTMLTYFIDDPGGWRLDRGDDAIALGNLILINSATCLAPILSLLVIFGVVASVAQNAPRFVLDRIQPDFSRMSIQKGFSRVFGLHGWTEFLKNVFKFGSVGTIAVIVLYAQKIALVNSMFYEVSDLPDRILGLAIRLISALVVATLMVASADLVWARIHWRRDQRMSRQEIKDEAKQMDGDPLLKARLRSIRMDRARKRMLTAVPKATMVIVNPTHYAVAMRYVRSEGGAPVVVAKGVDLIALRIREIAEENKIPIIEDKPLARSLYEVVKVDSTIPSEFYRAIAELIHLIHNKRSNWPLVRDRGAS